jgi:hypothetical protein
MALPWFIRTNSQVIHRYSQLAHQPPRLDLPGFPCKPCLSHVSFMIAIVEKLKTLNFLGKVGKSVILC